MIQANELKIGNWFIGYDNKPFKWQLSHFALMFKGVEVDEIIKEPIRLTEDILLKCGFNEGTTGYYFKDDIIISVEGQVYFGENEVYLCEIYTLHHLQNFCFDMGRELEINL